MNKAWGFLYRCGACGEIWMSGGRGSEKAVRKQLDLIFFGASLSERARHLDMGLPPPEKIRHYCHDGQEGIARIAGIREVK